MIVIVCFFFFFNDTATTEIYTLSLHDALPISTTGAGWKCSVVKIAQERKSHPWTRPLRLPHLARTRCVSRSGRVDRKSTRLNSSHSQISYAVFCLKKKNNTELSLDRDPPSRAN